MLGKNQYKENDPASGMPLSDMPIQRYAFIRYAMTRERSSRGGGAHHCLGEIVGAGSDLRELFGDVRLDMRIRRAGAARRSQRKLTRKASSMFERRLGIGVILRSRRIVDSEDLE